MRIRRILGLLCFGLVLTSCSRSPMETLEDYLAKRYDDRIKEGFVLSEIEKINGQKGEIMGVEVYQIDYKVTFKTDFDRYLIVGEFNTTENPTDKVNEDIEPSLYNLHPTDTIEMTDTYSLDGYVIGNFIGDEHQQHNYRTGQTLQAYYIFKAVKKGTPIVIKDDKRLVKTDNGWQVD